MDQSMEQMISQLKQNPAMLQSLISSQDGQMLMQMLTQNDRGAGLQQAVNAAIHGDTSGMVALMNRITQTQSGAELVQRISKNVKP